MAGPDKLKLLPAYTLAQAARLIGSNPSTLHAWFRGRNYKAFGRVKKTEAILPTISKPGQPISFIDVVEAHVLLLIRKGYGIPMTRIKSAADYLASIKGSLTFLSHKDFAVDRRDIFLNRDNVLISLSE